MPRAGFPCYNLMLVGKPQPHRRRAPTRNHHGGSHSWKSTLTWRRSSWRSPSSSSCSCRPRTPASAACSAAATWAYKTRSQVEKTLFNATVGLAIAFMCVALPGHRHRRWITLGQVSPLAGDHRSPRDCAWSPCSAIVPTTSPRYLLRLGGTLVEGIAAIPSSSTLLSQYSQVDGEATSLLFNGLTRLDERGEVVPDLAESMTISPDGWTYDFRQGAGLYWHDGMPVTAPTCSTPWWPCRRKASRASRAQRAVAPGGGHRAGRPGLTVRFTLDEPFAPFIDYTTIGLLPSHLWGAVPIADMMSSQYNSRPSARDRCAWWTSPRRRPSSR